MKNFNGSCIFFASLILLTNSPNSYPACINPNNSGGLTCSGTGNVIELTLQPVGTYTDITGTTITVGNSWSQAAFDWQQINNASISIKDSIFNAQTSQYVFKSVGLSNSSLLIDNLSINAQGSAGYIFNFWGIGTSNNALLNFKNSTFELSNRSILEIDGTGINIAFNNVQSHSTGNVGLLASGLNSVVSIIKSKIEGAQLTTLAAEYNGFLNWSVEDSVLTGNNQYGAILYLDTGSSENASQNTTGTLSVSNSNITSLNGPAINLMAPSTQLNPSGHSIHSYVVNVSGSNLSGALDTITDGVSYLGGIAGKSFILTINENSTITATNNNANAISLNTSSDILIDNAKINGNINLDTESHEVTVKNSIVNGNITMGVMNDSLTLVGSPSITGLINGGAGQNTLTLAGDGTSATLSSPIDNIAHFIKSGTGLWSVSSSLKDGSLGSIADLTINGGTLITMGANTYSGITNVVLGTLQAAAVNTFSANSDYTTFANGSLYLQSCVFA